MLTLVAKRGIGSEKRTCIPLHHLEQLLVLAFVMLRVTDLRFVYMTSQKILCQLTD